MKLTTLRLISIALLAAVCGAAPAYAQNARLQIDHLDKLFPKAVETVDVRVDGSLLLMASKFLRSDKADEAAVKEIVQALKGVYVKGVEFDKEGEYSDADVESIRQQLSAPGWERIVGVRSKRDGQNVEVFLMINNDAVIEGIGVLISDPKQVMVVNVVGPLDPEKINNLRGQFGIPKEFALDFGGAKKIRRGAN
ncbi:MAG TPA: DUF4252 domain-containing protein [Blastocatellia bacterium]|nr:DUF4252 domain-containing protein [Blastocatellia bacterium]